MSSFQVSPKWKFWNDDGWQQSAQPRLNMTDQSKTTINVFSPPIKRIGIKGKNQPANSFVFFPTVVSNVRGLTMPTLSLNAVTNLSNVPRQPNTHKKVKRGLTKQHTKGKHLLQRWAGLISGQREATRADGSSRVRPILALSLRDSAGERWANKGPWTLNDRLGEWSRPGTVHT